MAALRRPTAAVALLLAALVASATPGALATKAEMKMLANPIRRVVNMLQAMQKKVTEEGKKADELFEKYICYCKNSGGDLAASIERASAKVGELGPALEEKTSMKSQLQKDLASHEQDRAAAEKAIAEATALREKEKSAFDKEMAESKANYAAISQAIVALEKGMAGAFLQTREASVLRNFLSKDQALDDADSQKVLSFLSGEHGDGYAPAGGEILGLLKQMKDEMHQDIQEMTSAEEDAKNTSKELLEAKKKEKKALAQAIMDKLERIGHISVEIAETKNELGDTAKSLSEDKAFAADLKKNCGTKKGVHEEEKKMRAQEVVALADTINILNKDDALELFKKTLPSPSSSFLQIQMTDASLRAQARNLVAQARSKVRPGHGAVRFDFISLALNGRKVGLEKLVKMVDELIVTLKEEQSADYQKKEYCAAELDAADDKKKDVQRSISDIGTSMEETKDGISTLKEEIADLKKGIVSLDKSVTEATEQRKAENVEYKEAMASSAAAKEVLLFAKERLGKFYNAALLQATAASRSEGGDDDAVPPPPPPETAAAYQKKGQEAGGVISMIDLLVRTLDHEQSAAEKEEKTSQSEYEKTMADSAEKRAIDSKSVSDKEGAEADLEGELETSGAEQKSEGKDLKATEGYIATLHADCDWLVQYYDVRKEARSDEIDALQNAKAVLSGADFSGGADDMALLQLSSSHLRARKFLRQRSV